ncbi:hypothetical protein, partial [Mycobacterium senriense]
MTRIIGGAAGGRRIA